MADVIERLIFDDSKAIPALNNVRDAIKETDKAMESLNEETKKVSESIGKDVIKTNEQIAESTKKTAEAEKKALKEKIAATEVYGISLGKIREKLREYRTDLSNTLRVMASYVGLSKTQEEGVGRLVNVFGGGGKAIRAFAVGFNVLKVAIASTGIGALVLALGGLIAFFTKTQKGVDFLSTKFAGLRAVADVLIGTFAKVGEKIFDALDNPKQAAIDLYDTIKENLVNRLAAIPAFFVAFGKTIGNALTLNFDDAKKSALEAGRAVIQFGTGLDTEQQKAFGNAIKETTDAMTANRIEAENIEKALISLKREQAAFNTQFASSRAEIEKLKKIADDTTKSFSERIQAVKKGSELESDINKTNLRLLDSEIKLTQRKLNLKGAELITDADRNELYDLQLKRAEAYNDSLGKQTETQNTYNGLVKEYKDAVNSSKDALIELGKAYNLATAQEEFEFVKQKQITELERVIKLLQDAGGVSKETKQKFDFSKEIQLTTSLLEGLKKQEYFDPLIAEIDSVKTGLKGIVIDIPKIDPKLIIPTKKSWQDQFLEFLDGVETSGDLFNKIIDETFSFSDGEKIKGFTKGLQEFVTVFGDILNEATEIQISNIDKQLESLSKRREKLQDDLSKEQELYEKGLANNLGTKQAEVDGILAEEERLIAERDKLQREAQRRQILAETAQQAQALITSSIQIIKGFSNIPIVGLPLGIAAVGTLLGFFAKTKVDALKATKLYTGADRIDDYFGVPNRYGRSDIGNQKGYRLVDEDNGERTNVIISAREMLIPEKIVNQQRVFFDNLQAGLYSGIDISKLIASSTINKGIGVTNINHSHINLPRERKTIRQYVPFIGKDGVQRAVLKTITEDMKDGSIIEFEY